MILAALVDAEALLDVFIVSLVGAAGLTAVFSFGIVGVTRFDERRRGGGAKIGYALLAIVCALIVTGAIVQGIIVMTSK